MNVQELMNRAVRTCSEGDTLEQAARMMWECDVGCLVVTDSEKRPLGMITDRDVVMAAYTQGIPLRDGIVRSAMSPNLLTVFPSCSLDYLHRLMQEARVRRVPVVDDSGQLVGIITLGDLAQYSQWTVNHSMGAHGVARTLSAVSEARSSSAKPASEERWRYSLPTASRSL